MKIHEYEFNKPFKEGGMGRIYLGKHILLGVDIIIKELILNNDPVAEELFLKEAKILYEGKGVRHPSIPAIKDYFVHNGRHFLVMDYMPGKSMQDFLDLGKQFEEDTVCWIADRILAGLALLHRKGVIHRDIKPGNIILDLGEHRAALVDFGIARKATDQPEVEEGRKTYTRYFASPEQYRGENCIAQSDIYSLGATMYNALTGKLPLESKNLKRDGDLEPPHLIDPRIHPQLSAVITKAMRLNPAERFKSAGEMKEICDQVRMKYVNPNWKPPA